MAQNSKNNWWSEEYGFFGSFYMEGDNSKDGYLIEKKQKLAERTQAEVSGVISLLKLEVGSKILDCPCGYGRHSIELAKRGFIVTGSDINSVHLQKTNGEKHENVIFVKENMIDIFYENEFDAVVNMFYSFGFFETDGENEKVLKNFFKALKSGGKFLMHTDVNIPRILARKYKETEERSLANGKSLVIHDSYDPTTKRINGSWIIKDGNTEVRKEYSVRVYTRTEFVDMCRSAGFSSVTTYSDWDGNPYSEDSEDMIIVATK